MGKKPRFGIRDSRFVQKPNIAVILTLSCNSEALKKPKNPFLGKGESGVLLTAYCRLPLGLGRANLQFKICTLQFEMNLFVGGSIPLAPASVPWGHCGIFPPGTLSNSERLNKKGYLYTL